MMTQPRGAHPNLSLAISILALFIALGGSAVAVTVAGKNSVTSKSIKNGQVKTKDLGNAAVTGSKLGTDAVEGAQLADGAVSGANILDDAVSGSKITNKTITAADVSSALYGALTDGCPANMNEVSGTVCLEQFNARGTATWQQAAVTCSLAGMRLPSVGELYLAAKSFTAAGPPVLDIGVSYWSETGYQDDDGTTDARRAVYVSTNPFGQDPQFGAADSTAGELPFVCATIPSDG